MSNAIVNLVPGLSHRSPRQYPCRHCDKVFKRSEHCSRHERSHTRERPFSCRYCGRSYARKDLVKRHERTLHADYLHSLDHASSTASSRTQDGQGLQQRNSSQNGPPLVHIVDSPPVSPRDRRASYAPSPPSTSQILVDAHPADVVTGDGETARQIEIISDSPSSPTSTQALSHPSPEISQDFNLYYSGSPLAVQPGSQSPGVPRTATDSNVQSKSIAEHRSAHQDNGSDQPSDIFPQLGQVREVDMEIFPNTPFLDLMPITDQSLGSIPDPPTLEMSNWLEFPGISRMDSGNDGLSNGVSPEQPSVSVPNRNGAQPTSQHLSPEPSSTKHLPSFLEKTRLSHPKFTMCDKTYASICNGLSEHLLIETIDEMPSAKLCQSFLTSYMNSFQHHLPVIHLSSFCLYTTPSPLILAMCSIGALYRLDRIRARRLYDMATRAIISTPITIHCDTSDSNDLPLWLVQTKLLLTYYGILSGEKGLVSYSVNDSGFFTLVYEKMRLSLQQESSQAFSMNWQDWIRHESWKRVLAGIYIVSSLNMVIFVINPSFNAAQDLEIDLLADEGLWNATSAEAWRELQNKSASQNGQTIKAVLADIISQGVCQNKPYSIAPFSALFAMHAMVVHIWQLFQVAQTLAQDPFMPTSSCDLLGSSLIDRGIESLKRCQELLKHAQRQEHYVDDDANVSLVFDCHALMRIAYIRLFGTAIRFENLCIISPEWPEIEASFSRFAATKLERTPHLLEVVQICLEGLRISSKPGFLLVRKKAAFSWSIEHAIAAWLSSLLMTKWVHSIEIDMLYDMMPTPLERQLLESMKSIVEEVEPDINDKKSLASALARVWSLCIYDVWVWGILPRLGALLEKLAVAFELDNESHRH